ncbi:hypothetical protein HMN09_01007900 [Mycena chlorophos]|uniref:CxC5 like cysteine cluster associated with KDZ domain-containing protein n=1 Tax=Mycena chlorophos TaxID=658473 RepID=A0A8H6VZW4_MYCCL|nr:hypothetical protein HMN09_01007900 [Mycena chlorophos]
MEDTWTAIYEKLKAVPGLCDVIGMEKGMQFVRMAARLKDAILAAQPPTGPSETPPERLPPTIELFLGSAVEMHPDFVHGCWTAFRGLVWDYKGDEEDEKAFRSGLGQGIAMQMLFPPIHHCTTAGCTNTRLLRTRSQPSQVVYYTLANGACPAFAHRLTCDTCGTRYYPNYRVNDHVRTYYEKIPNAIQVGEHQYLETIIVNLFINLMLISWTSATNGARIYDQALSQPENILCEHPDWVSTSFKLRPEHVWDGFIVLCLLEDYQRRGETLRVPHTGDQKDRFTKAMSDRNAHFQFFGQPEWAHYCNKCLRVYKNESGTLSRIHVIVADGITIGHPCCGVRHCTVPLASNRDRYCPDHVDEEKICAVETCRGESEHEKGFQTCSDLAHRYLELMHRKHDKAFFQLSARVARPGVSNPEDTFAAEATESGEVEMEDLDELNATVEGMDKDVLNEAVRAASEEPDTSSEGTSSSQFPAKPTPKPVAARAANLTECPANKNPNGNRTLRALFGRRKSHNEQIFLRSCAVIVAHRTFYGSETVPQMADMLHKTFRHEDTMPEIVIYDNNCTLYKHLASIKDPLIDKNGLNVGFPVDVFHWECKHKKEGIECSVHCNPRLFPELLGENGKAWFFNSSVAEQTNVWLGGFHSILREMGAVKYNFF